MPGRPIPVTRGWRAGTLRLGPPCGAARARDHLLVGWVKRSVPTKVQLDKMVRTARSPSQTGMHARMAPLPTLQLLFRGFASKRRNKAIVPYGPR
jgi:hypothetical protein